MIESYKSPEEDFVDVLENFENAILDLIYILCSMSIVIPLVVYISSLIL